MDTQRKALQQAFGDSSSSDTDDGDENTPLVFSTQENKKPIWESVERVKGLWICRDFLSEKEQSLLLSAIEREGWFTESFHNQAMRFGDLPQWATELSRSIHGAACFGDVSFRGNDLVSEDQCTEEHCPLPFVLLWREPLFDQLIVNKYKAGEGICAHVDLMRFEDGIAIVSMESACIMHFSRSAELREDEDGSSAKIPVFLSPGSLILMSGEARYLWKHEINRKPGCQMWEGKEILQQRRTSVTLRKLCGSTM